MPSTRRGLLVACGAASAALAGCTTLERTRERVGDVRREPPERRVHPDWTPAPGTWAGWDYDLANTGHNPHATPPKESPTLAWEADIEGRARRLVVAENRVFASSREAVIGLDAESGERLWHHDVDGFRALTYIDGRLYERGRNQLQARTLDGALQWELSSEPWLQAVVERDGYVFASTSRGYLTIHADTGEVVRERDGPEDQFQFVATDGEALYATSTTRVHAYDSVGRTLEQRWSERPDSHHTYGVPTVAGGRVYIGHLHGPDDDRGRISWYGTDGTRRGDAVVEQTPLGISVANGSMFVGTADVSGGSLGEEGGLLALGADGERLWTFDTDAGVTRPTVADGTVYVGPFSNSRVPVAAFDAESGQELWRREASGTVRLAAAGETLYVGDTSIRALR